MAGATLRGTMARTRQSTIGSFARAACASSAELTSHRRISPSEFARTAGAWQRRTATHRPTGRETVSICRGSKYSTLVGPCPRKGSCRSADSGCTLPPTYPRRSRLAQAHGDRPSAKGGFAVYFGPSPLRSAPRSIIRACLGDRTSRHAYEVRSSQLLSDADACRSSSIQRSGGMPFPQRPSLGRTIQIWRSASLGLAL